MGKDLIKRGLNKAVFLLRKAYAILFRKRKIYVFNWYNWVKIDYERYLKKVVINSFVQIITRYKFYKTYDKGQSKSYNVKIKIDDFKDFTYQDYKLWEICKSPTWSRIWMVRLYRPSRRIYSLSSRVFRVWATAAWLMPSSEAADRRLGEMPVALAGRVYVLADASEGAIEPGDLLTTSALPGHAMKATDLTAAQGAILGKAMTSLEEGTGLVLVLVTLQ